MLLSSLTISVNLLLTSTLGMGKSGWGPADEDSSSEGRVTKHRHHGDAQEGSLEKRWWGQRRDDREYKQSRARKFSEDLSGGGVLRALGRVGEVI